VFELTRDYDAILPLMLATVLADIVAGALLHDSLMTEKLSRRGVHVPSDYHVDVLGSVLVRDVMTTDVKTLWRGLTVREAVSSFRRGGHGAYPVVDDDDRCIGMLTRNDLLERSLDDDLPLAQVDLRDPVTVAPDDAVLVALETMLEEGVEHLVILDADRRVVGVCTRTDILSARQQTFALDRRQNGWLADLPRREGSDGRLGVTSSRSGTGGTH
jgi:CBS domain-containing protein